jgi:regulator of sirC expression with transglutaminase-like and TPR domain|tara:strand:+ start:376 stop:1170 length:795 start_codon:yes stop_codon:yes gene_type:complete
MAKGRQAVRLGTGLLAAICLLALPAALADEHDSPEIRYLTCVALVESAPEAALKRAQDWHGRGGGTAARHCLALALVALGRPVDAGRELENVAEAMRREAGVEPDKNQSMALANVLAQAGNAWLLAGQAKRARRALNQALALAPEDPDMLVDRAVVAAALEDFGTALADLDLALAHEADHVEAHAYRASALHRLERRPEALAAAQRALDILPGHPGARLERGILRQLAGDTAGARQDWQFLLDQAAGTKEAEAAAKYLKALPAD